MKIMILEDEQAELTRLKQFLDQYSAENEIVSFSLETYGRGSELLNAYQCDADIVLLDIRVPDMLGIEVAKRIRAMDDRVIIVFVTNYSQYAIDGYSVGAFDYILKPLHYSSFRAKMNRILRKLSHNEIGSFLVVKNKNTESRILVGSITYIEGTGHHITIHTNSKTVTQWGSLGAFEEKLKDAHFVRCHTSYLVNLKYVQGISEGNAIVADQEIPISRLRRRVFLEILAQYRGGTK